jgi:hypothetical protein
MRAALFSLARRSREADERRSEEDGERQCRNE